MVPIERTDPASYGKQCSQEPSRTSKATFNLEDLVFRIGHCRSQSGTRSDGLTGRKKRRWSPLKDSNLSRVVRPQSGTSRRLAQCLNLPCSTITALERPAVATIAVKEGDTGCLDSVAVLVDGHHSNCTEDSLIGRVVSFGPALPEHSNAATTSSNIGSAPNNASERRPVVPAEAASPRRKVATRHERVQFEPKATTYIAENALKFVGSVLTMVNDLSQMEGSQVEPIDADDLFCMTMRTLSLQLAFHVDGKPTTVDLGYHYTTKGNLGTIRSSGLMNMQERVAHGLPAVQNNGNKYGQGIYTATNPCAWHGRYGEIGLIVARLRGTNTDFDPKCANRTHDSVTIHRGHCRECVVLATSEQCMPILQFDANQISRNSHIHPGNMLVNRYHIALQSVIDNMFNRKEIPKH
jgi:hypothetical protein